MYKTILKLTVLFFFTTIALYAGNKTQYNNKQDPVNISLNNNDKISSSNIINQQERKNPNRSMERDPDSGYKKQSYETQNKSLNMNRDKVTHQQNKNSIVNNSDIQMQKQHIVPKSEGKRLLQKQEYQENMEEVKNPTKK